MVFWQQSQLLPGGSPLEENAKSKGEEGCEGAQSEGYGRETCCFHLLPSLNAWYRLPSSYLKSVAELASDVSYLLEHFNISTSLQSRLTSLTTQNPRLRMSNRRTRHHPAQEVNGNNFSTLTSHKYPHEARVQRRNPKRNGPHEQKLKIQHTSTTNVSPTRRCSSSCHCSCRRPSLPRDSVSLGDPDDASMLRQLMAVSLLSHRFCVTAVSPSQPPIGSPSQYIESEWPVDAIQQHGPLTARTPGTQS